MVVSDVPAREVVQEALTWPDRANAIRIVNADTCTKAGTMLTGIKALRKRIAEVFDPHIKRAFDAHRALTREKADAEAPLAEAERVLKGALSAYDLEQDRIRREAQRRADEEARKREEDERLSRAAAMETEGQDYGDSALVAEAHALLEAPVAPIVAAPIEKATPKVSGISYRDVWKFRVVNAQLVPDQYVIRTVNDAAIRGVVNGLKGETKIPGIEVYCERQVAAGAR